MDDRLIIRSKDSAAEAKRKRNLGQRGDRKKRSTHDSMVWGVGKGGVRVRFRRLGYGNRGEGGGKKEGKWGDPMDKKHRGVRRKRITFTVVAGWGGREKHHDSQFASSNVAEEGKDE